MAVMPISPLQADRWIGRFRPAMASAPGAGRNQGGDALSDDALVDVIVRRGDPSHFRLLVSRYKGKVHGIALSVLGPTGASEAEDVAQEAFMRAYERLDSFRGDSKFSTWLYRIAYNIAIDHQRRVQKRRSVPFDESHADDGQPAADQLMADRVASAVEALPSTQRIAVHQFYWLGLKVREIAELLGCSQSAVKVSLMRARRQLAQELEEIRDE